MPRGSLIDNSKDIINWGSFRVCDHTDNNNAIVVSSQSIPSLISEGLATAYYIYAQCLFTGQGSARNTQLSNIFFTKVINFFELH